MGSPRQSRIFFHRTELPEFNFLKPYDYFVTPIDKFYFTDTKSPYTNLSYNESGNKITGDDRFRAYFATNAGKKFGVGFLFDYLYGRGRYDNQSTAYMNFSLYSYYRSDKYNYHLLASRYHIKGVTYYNMLFPQPIKFSTQIPHVVYSGQTVTYSMMQFAAYMGFKEIYLIGVDCNYSAGNSVITADSYFNPKLFNGSRSYAAPEIDTNLLAYACARNVCDKLGIKVYNATRGGKLELFERANLDAVLGK